MPQNLELKARISSMSKAIRIARNLRVNFRGTIWQRDIYFNIPHGRLKLRMNRSKSAELIYYSRPNKKGERYSDYCILPVLDANSMDAFCSKAFGRKVVVEKSRKLYLYKNARIHIDNVRGLGYFIEFEVLVLKGKNQAESLMSTLIKHFGINYGEIISGSYEDLLQN